MIALLHLLWWMLALILLPLLVPLAWHTRRHALRLPPAAGPQSGEVGDGQVLRLLLLGESTVAGVGVERQSEGLAAQLARALAAQGGAVAWRALGENGITAAQAAERLLPASLEAPADLVLLVFGVNDCTHFSSRRVWREGLRRLTEDWQARGAQVIFSAVPPLAHFHALPWLLRRLLGWRAALLDRDLRALAAELGARHCALNMPFTAQYLASDGYHPSALGYRAWAEGLASCLSVARPARQAPRRHARCVRF